MRYGGGFGADSGADLAVGITGDLLDPLLAHAGIEIQRSYAEPLQLREMLGVDFLGPVSRWHGGLCSLVLFYFIYSFRFLFFGAICLAAFVIYPHTHTCAHPLFLALQSLVPVLSVQYTIR